MKFPYVLQRKGVADKTWMTLRQFRTESGALVWRDRLRKRFKANRYRVRGAS